MDRVSELNQNIQDMTHRIVETVDPEQIILFGSHAKNRETPDSDIDFLVIERENFGPGRSRRREIARLYQALRSFGVPKDILLYSREECERWRHARDHIIATAMREGKVLYERPR